MTLTTFPDRAIVQLGERLEDMRGAQAEDIQSERPDIIVGSGAIRRALIE
jgi:hypothetical protein